MTETGTAVWETPDALRLTGDGPGRFLATSLGDPDRHDVVFGGQIIAQMILAARVAGPAREKELVSVHTVFTRAATLTRPLEISVETVRDGRSAGSADVTVGQGERICARGLTLHQRAEPDLIGHQPPMPDLGGPEVAPDGTGPPPAGLVAPGTEVRVAGGADTWDPDAPVGPAELGVWLRLPDDQRHPDRPGLAQALLGYATGGFLIGTAMRPHPGIGQAMAHRGLDTGVLTHTLSFHRPIRPGRWLLMAHEGSFAGAGRAYGRAHVFDEGGELIASFVQESLLRAAHPIEHI